MKNRAILLFILFILILFLSACSKKDASPIKNELVDAFGSFENTEDIDKTLDNDKNKEEKDASSFNYQELYYKKNLSKEEKISLFDFYMELRKSEVFSNKMSTPDNILNIYKVISTSQIVYDEEQEVSETDLKIANQFNQVYAKQNLGYSWTVQALNWLKADRDKGLYYVSTDTWSNAEVVTEDIGTFAIRVVYKTSGYWVEIETDEKIKNFKPEYKTKYYNFIYIENSGWRIFEMTEY